MSDPVREAFRERMVAAIRFFAAAPDQAEARRELASLLAYGSGAIELFDREVSEMSRQGILNRASFATLRAFAVHIERAGDRRDGGLAWLDIPLEADAADETVVQPGGIAEDSAPTRAQGAEADESEDPEPEPEEGPPLSAGTTLADRYIVEEPIARGGMSTVYRGTDTRDGRRIAIKLMRADFATDPEIVSAFEREADNAWSVDHPGLLKVLAQGRYDGRPFLAMEYLDGQSLGAALRGRFAVGASWRETRQIVRKIGAAVAHAHSKGLVHSDLKPGNVFLLRNGGVKVLDFGAAQFLHRDRVLDGDRASSSGLGALTPAYASPEMLSGEPAEPRDDVFAVAVLAYEILTGTHPYERQPADRARHLSLEPRRPKRIPAYAWRALKSALSLRRSDRPRSVQAFLARLDQPFPVATIGFGVLILAAAAGVVVLANQRPDLVRGWSQDLGTGARLIGYTAGIGTLPDEPQPWLAMSERIATGTGWTGPRDRIVGELRDRLSEAIGTDGTATDLDRALETFDQLRPRHLGPEAHKRTVFILSRQLSDRLSDLIQSSDPLSASAILRILATLDRIDPDAIRILTPHLRDLLAERRRTAQATGETVDFEERLAVVVNRYPGLAPQPSPPAPDR